MARVKALLALLFLAGNDFVLGSPATKVNGQTNGGQVTCPGFPGYCSESYPGDTCLVVCAFGRNNVPECQPDGTWTDIPRCIEHEPGVPEQIPGLCPGIPGYCSIDYPGGICEFDCLTGPDIRSFCTPDGTWDPYPTCDGDIRETRDGCDPCPGPFGGPRNRTAEGNSGAAPARNRNTRPPAPKQVAAPTANRAEGGHSNRRQQQPQQQSQRPREQPRAQGRPQPQAVTAPTNVKKSNNFSGQQHQPQQQHKQHQPQQQQKQQPWQQQARPQHNQANSVTSGSCPGGSLEACIDVCPSDSARIFGACVSGCAKRCPSKK